MSTITPPPELVQQWWEESDQYQDDPKTYFDYVATEAAQWGADQELEACCEWLEDWVGNDSYAVPMRATRRPKPPSLKEQALAVLDDVSDRLDAAHENAIRRALEQLPDHE